MLRVAVASDLHLEMHSDPRAVVEADWSGLGDLDLVLLAGDVHVGSVDTFAAVEHIQKTTGAHVVWIAGNHEHYGFEIDQNLADMQAMMAFHGNGNCTFLENATRTLELRGKNVQVLGCTLWTDFELYGCAQSAMAEADLSFNDCRKILCKTTKHKLFTAKEAKHRHMLSRSWLVGAFQESFDGLRLVMTHHAPTRVAIDPRFDHSPLNAGFVSDLDWEIHRFTPDLWVWGHTHHSVDVMVGKTRCVSAQKGYPGEHGKDFRPRIIEFSL